MTRYDFARVEDADTSTLALRLGVHRAQINRWRRNGLTADAAERVAHALGLCALTVWPEIVDDQIAALEVECAAEGCTNRFVRGPRGGKFRVWCSDVCASRERMRRYRATERGRQANRVYKARYVAEVREAKARRDAKKSASPPSDPRDASSKVAA